MPAISVGEVSIKVKPDTKGFREKVEQDLSKLRDVEIGVNPKTAGLRKKIEESAKGAKTEVEVDVDDSKLKKLDKKPKNRKYSVTVDTIINQSSALKSFRALATELDNIPLKHRVQLVPDTAALKAGAALPTIRQELQAIGSIGRIAIAGGIGKSLNGLSASARKVEDGFRGIRNGIRTIRDSRGIKGLGATLKGLGRVVKSTGSGFIALGSTVKWATGGYNVDKRLLKFLNSVKTEAGSAKRDLANLASTKIKAPIEGWLDGIKGKTRDAKREMFWYKEYAKQVVLDTATDRRKKAVDKLKNSVDSLAKAHDAKVEGKITKEREKSIKVIEEEIKALRKLKGGFKVLHPGRRKSAARATAPDRKELLRLEKYLKTLKGFDNEDLGEAIPKLKKRIQDLRYSLKATAFEQEEFRKRTEDLNKSAARIKRLDGLKSTSLFDRINLKKDFDTLRRAKELASSLGEDTRFNPIPDSVVEKLVRIRDSFRDSKASAGVAKLRDNIRGLGESIRSIPSPKNPLDVTGPLSRVVAFRNRLREAAAEANKAPRALLQFGNAAEAAGESTRGIMPKRDVKRIKNGGNVVRHASRKILGLTRMGWIVSAVIAVAAPAFSAIAGIASALPALGGVALAGLAAVVLGFDGIKSAATAAAPAVDNLKSELSGVFQERMTPQFEKLGQVLSDITPQMKQVANGFSDFTAGMVQGVSNPKSLASIQKFLSNSAGLLSDLAPFARDFTSGMVEMAEVGSRTFPHLANGLNSFGKSFSESVSRMGKSGELQQAIEATYDTLGSFGTNIGKIFGAAIEQAPKMSDALIPLFDGLGDGISDLMPLLADISGSVGPILGQLAESLGDIGAAIGPEAGSVLRDLTPALSGFIDVAGRFAGVALDGVFSFLDTISPVAVGTINGVTTALEGLYRAMPTEKRPYEPLDPRMFEDINKLSNTKVPDLEASGWSKFWNGIGDTLNNLKNIREAGDVSEEARRHVEGLRSIEEIYDGVDLNFSFGDKLLHGLNQQTSIMKNGYQVALQDVKQVNLDAGTQINQGAADLKAAAERAMEANQIDLKPIIRKVETATSLDELNSIRDELTTAIQQGGIDAVEMRVSVNPKVDMDGALANLRSTLDGDMANLNQTIDQFIVDASAVSKELNVDISPQINVLRNATTEGEARAAIQDIMAQISTAGQLSDSQVDVLTKPNVSVDPATDTSAPAEQMKSQVQTDMQNALNGLGTDLNVDTSGVSTQVATSMETSLSTALASVGTTIGTALGSTPIDTAGLSTNVGNAISTALTSVAVAPDVSGIGNSIGSALAGISIPTGGLTSAVNSAVSNALSAMSTSVSASLVLDLTSNGANAGNTFVSGLQGTQGAVQSAANSIKSAANIPAPNNYSSGVAVGSTFAAGIRSQIGAVSAAANELAAAARSKMPNSPADEGPFSGSGWIEHSGDSIGITFAAGIRRQVSNVSDAATELTNAARVEFNDIATAPEATMKAYHRKRILDPVLEHNAEQLARFRENNAKAEEDHAKRVGEANEATAKSQANGAKDSAKAVQQGNERIAKADEALQERLNKNREDLEKNLKTPDYSDINMSVNEYWIQGLKDMFKQKLGNLVDTIDLPGQLRSSAHAGVAQIRKEFGDHPILADVEANVDSDHFEWTIKKVFDESGLSEVPVNLVVDNIDELKDTLNMGDGFVSRAIDQAMDYNTNNTDAKQYRDRQVTEVHYHVEDMEEAIRRENIRERKAMMKLR